MNPPADTVGGPDGVTAPSSAARGVTLRSAANVAWHRAREFTVLSRVPILGAIIAPWVWPFYLLMVGMEGGKIRSLGPASVTIDFGEPRRPHRPAVLLGIGALLAELLLAGEIGFQVAARNSDTAAGGTNPRAIAIVVSLLVLFPLILFLTGLVGHTLRHRGAFLGRRQQQLAAAGQPAGVLTSLVRSRRPFAQHTPKALLEALTVEWRAAHAVVVLYPAHHKLTDYYRDRGAAVDPAGDGRMLFEYRG